jgi:hypothetical protein
MIDIGMNPTYSKWDEFEREKRAGMPPLFDPTTLPTTQVPRIRREYNAQDAINSRAWDFFHATPPLLVTSEGLRTKNAPVHMDMNPINSRINTVQYRTQPEYMPDLPRGPVTTGGLAPPPSGSLTAPSATFSGNPYTQRLNAGGQDARNMIRELRSAVVEDNRERATDAARALAERQFTDRWLPARSAADAASLQAYELLRSKPDEWR